MPQFFTRTNLMVELGLHSCSESKINLFPLNLRSLLKQNDGSIINISDSNADFARKGYSIYSISKSGLNSLTRSLALELALKLESMASAWRNHLGR